MATRTIADLVSLNLLDVNILTPEGLTSVHVAIKSQKYYLAKALVENGVDPSAKTRTGETALGMVIDALLPGVVKIFLDHNADLINVCPDGTSALWLATTRKPTSERGISKRIRIINSILSVGMESGCQLKADYYKLCRAIMKNDVQSSAELINLCEDVDFGNLNVESPFEFAVYLNRVEIAELLLQKGAKLNFQPKNLQLILESLLGETRAVEMVSLLLKFKLNMRFFDIFLVNSANEVCIETPLFRATKLKNLKLMEFLLDKGIEVNALGRWACGRTETALHWTCREGWLEGVKLLVNYFADVNFRDSHGCTPLFYAANDSRIVEFLFENGAKVDLKNVTGSTAILWACHFANELETIDLLLKRGAKLSAENLAKDTVLHFVAQNQNFSVVRYILKLAADRGIVDPNALTESGRNPLHFVNHAMAYETACDNFLQFLKRGVNVNQRSIEGWFPGHVCRTRQMATTCCALEYLQRLKHLGMKVEGTDFDFGLLEVDFTDSYNQELEEMKTQEISSYPIKTMYDLLFMKKNSLMRCSRNKKLKKVFVNCDRDFETTYPYFGNMLNLQYRRGIRRRCMTVSAMANLSKVTGEWMPEICGEKILKHLGDKDLRKLSKKNFGNVECPSEDCLDLTCIFGQV